MQLVRIQNREQRSDYIRLQKNKVFESLSIFSEPQKSQKSTKEHKSLSHFAFVTFVVQSKYLEKLCVLLCLCGEK